jgi:radical SAM superfamily enzyme YgiQ (UPF0313 family)
MQITFIKPTLGSLNDGERFVDEARMEPLSLAVLAGLTPVGVDCRLYDDRIDEIDYDEPTDLVAINVETFTARRAYEIAAEYRARKVPVVMGGMHASLIPDEVAEHADAVYTGDGEELWSQVVSDAHEGRLRPRYAGTFGVPQSRVLPRRDLYVGKHYLPVSLLQFGRGCRFNCEFCAVSKYFGHCNFTRPVAEVVAEISAQSRRDLFFVDDNFVSNPEAAKELLRALIPLKVRWVSQVSIEHTRDAEMMDLLVKSGCMGNVIGFESLDLENLRQMRKAANLTAFDGYADAVATLREHHLQTWAAFALGYDHDTVESILKTCEWGISNHFTFAAFNVLMPYPSTPFYERLKAEDRLLYDGRWWLHPDYRFNHAAFRPARMSADELTDTAWACRQRWSSWASIVQRGLDPQTNLATPFRFATYCAYNPLFRREAFKRQSMRLGTR